MNKQFLFPALLSSLFFTLPACGSSGSDVEVDCSEGKCDTPGSTATAECRAEFPNDAQAQQECRDGKALDHCEARRSDALDSAQVAFTENAIRWAAADVEGVNLNGADDRGQEYTEYFAVVLPPPEVEGDEAPARVALGQNQASGGTSSPSIELTEDQIFALEDEPDATVGQCVFTSWHADIDVPYAACEGSYGSCPDVSFPEGLSLASWIDSSSLGIAMDADELRMKVGFNSNNAASDLAMRCMTDPLVGNPEDASDPLNDNFIRGCMKAYDLFQTEWRRSDSAVCVAGGRLAECGCGVDTDGDQIADITDPEQIALALVPKQPVDGEVTLRGFPLGTWTGMNELPTGCSYGTTGDDSQTLVLCDLSANDLLQGAADVKERCRAKYGNNVVTHVPVPAAAIVCSPPEDGVYSASCQEHPWVVTSENARGGAPAGSN